MTDDRKKGDSGDRPGADALSKIRKRAEEQVSRLPTPDPSSLSIAIHEDHSEPLSEEALHPQGSPNDRRRAPGHATPLALCRGERGGGTAGRRDGGTAGRTCAGVSRAATSLEGEQWPPRSHLRSTPMR